MHRLTSLFVVSFIAAGLLVGCTPPRPAGPESAPPPAPSAPQRTLVIAVREEPPSIAVKALVDFSGSLRRPNYLFNATLDWRNERGVSQPYLAEALPQLNTSTWQVFPDGRMETSYRLRPNLTWHDGAPLTGEDFAFAWRVYSNPEYGLARAAPLSLISDIVAPDAGSVVIRWQRTYPDALGLDEEFQPLPRHILASRLQELDAASFIALPFWTSGFVGAGAFRVTGWSPGAFITGEAFPGYALGRPKIDKIEVRFIRDPQTAVANLLADAVHFVTDPILSVSEGQTLEQQWAQNRAGTVLYAPVTLRTSLFQLRPEVVEHPALLDVRVRRAVVHGFDRNTAVEVLEAGKGTPTDTMTHPREVYYPEIERAIQKYPYDPRRAQAVMEEAGYAKGSAGFFVAQDGQPIRFSVASSSGTRNESEVTTYVDALRRAGFDATQKVVSAAEIDDPQFRALLPGLQVRGGANEHRRYVSEQIPRADNRWRGDNRGGWSNPEYDRLTQAHLTTLDPAEQVRLLAEMERILTTEVPLVPNYFSAYTVPHVAALRGPVAREVPRSSDNAFMYVHQWEWRS